MGLLAASATLIDISGGLIEMHFMFFVVIVVLTLYEDWLPFLLAVAFVLIHHGIMGTLDPRAVFADQREWRNPWAWATLHAGLHRPGRGRQCDRLGPQRAGPRADAGDPGGARRGSA